MYSIGEFSKISGLTVKALRLYHDKQILIPNSVDQNSGYRYYGKADIDKARVIIALKSMRFSLTEIQSLMANYADDGDIVSFLKSRQAAVKKEVQALTSISSVIDMIVRKETEVKKMKDQDSYQVEIKVLPELQVLTTRWKGSYQDTGKAMTLLYKAAGRHADGVALNLYYDGEYKEQDADIESCLPVKREKTAKNCEFKVLLAGEFVTLIHKGPYETIGRTYARLFDYLNAQGLKTTLPTREVYLKGPGLLFKGNPERYLTELQIPLSAD